MCTVGDILRLLFLFDIFLLFLGKSLTRNEKLRLSERLLVLLYHCHFKDHTPCHTWRETVSFSTSSPSIKNREGCYYVNMTKKDYWLRYNRQANLWTSGWPASSLHVNELWYWKRVNSQQKVCKQLRDLCRYFLSANIPAQLGESVEMTLDVTCFFHMTMTAIRRQFYQICYLRTCIFPVVLKFFNFKKKIIFQLFSNVLYRCSNLC